MQPRLFEEWIKEGYQQVANLCSACAHPTDEHSWVRGEVGFNQGSFVHLTKACGGWVFVVVNGVGCVDVK